MKRLLLVTLVTIYALPLAAHADTKYQSAPHPIDQILQAPQPPGIAISDDQKWLVEFERPSMPSIADLAEPIEKLAGVELNTAVNGPAREYYWRNIAVRKLGPGKSKPVELPDNPRIQNIRFSGDSKRVAFTHTTESGIELWVVELATRQARRLTPPILNAAYGSPCDWLPGDDGFVCKVIPDDRGDAPTKARIPTGPLVEENLGRATPARTYTNLLQSPHDEVLFEYYFTSALDHVSLDGKRTRLVEPAVIDEATPSPDGRYLLVQTLHEPWSYHVPASRFPVRIQVIDRTTKKVVYEVADLPLADNIPITFGSVRTGRRTVGWRNDEAATLYWVEALDGGDAGKEASERDAVYTLAAPFEGKPALLWKSALRYGGVSWGRADVALASEWWYDTRQVRTWRIDPSQPSAEPFLLIDRNYQDAYAHPGSPIYERGKYGTWVLRFTPDGKSVYMSGQGASPEGVFPFLDTFDLFTKKTDRLWQCRAPYYETVVELLDDEGKELITNRQSKTQPPNYFVRTGKKHRKAKALTRFEDPAPQLAGMHKELVKYKRADGLQLSATLYLPPGYKKSQGPLPTLLWAYPSEFKTKETAAQVTTSEYTFSRPSGLSTLFLLTQGYAVMANPTMPIIGEGDEEPNDTYVEQLVAGAEAAVDYVVKRGVSDRDRMAIGGHSYGAFTAANLLAHTDLFRAGIARSGAYNRSLTPFGFQSEQRSFWEATDVYMEMSPFTQASKIDEPLLLIHGAEDSNPGTYPIQSERMYEALKGLGGTVRWVVLPLEDHGYRALESAEHMHWEQIQWLDKYVKNAPPRG